MENKGYESGIQIALQFNNERNQRVRALKGLSEFAIKEKTDNRKVFSNSAVNTCMRIMQLIKRARKN